MQIGTPTPTPPPVHIGATNANGWVYGLFELGVVIAFVLLITLPFWGDRFINWVSRPFGSSRRDADDR